MPGQYSPSITYLSLSSYQDGRYLFHVATVDLLTFICVSENTFERKVAYNFLDRVADELVKSGLQVSV